MMRDELDYCRWEDDGGAVSPYEERSSDRGQIATVGCTVEIERDRELREKWTIGAEGESDIDAGVIAWNSPLGRALLGSVGGEERTFIVGVETVVVSVVSVAANGLGGGGDAGR